jgi:M6 family metalloprotease-like protein
MERDPKKRFARISKLREPMHKPRDFELPRDHGKLSMVDQARILRARRDIAGTDFVSVALFFNLTAPANTAGGYMNTDTAAVRAWLREGQTPTTSDFMRRYWSTLSYNNFQFGVDANRDASNNILIPTITPAGNNANDWGNIAQQIIQANPQRIWAISGSRVDGTRRIIPSVVVVQNYNTGASALFQWDWEFSSGGATYRVQDIFHIQYGTGLNEFNLPGTWATICHEYAHNFLQGADLYGGGGGKIGYWDLLGDNSPPGNMSDTSSFYKVRLNWMSYNAVLNGPVLAAAEYSLGPFATTGDAYKVVPDPLLNPGEYFLLEYRAATGGDPAWTPDQALGTGGLLITHINERLGDWAPGVVSSSPFMDVEEADRNDGKCWDDRGVCDLPWSDPPGVGAGSTGVSTYPPNNWPGWNRPAGTLYPFGGNDRFTPDSDPSSDLYGGRRSGLSITNIRRVGNEMRFTLEMTGLDQTALQLRPSTRYWLADFNGDGLDEVLVFDGDTLALCEYRQNQLHVTWRVRDWIGGWNLDQRDRLYIGDFNGDGRADVFIRSDRWAGLLISDGKRLNQVWITGDPAQNRDWIGGWHLGSGDEHYVGDFDGDGVDDIFIRSARWAGLLLSTGSGFENVWMTGDPAQNRDWIGGWHLGPQDRHYVGDFDGDGRDDIFIRSDLWAGLLLSNGRGFENVWMTGDPAQNRNWIGGWRLGPQDRHFVGDFDGNGRDDIFIRSDRWAGLLLSNGRGFENVWMTGDPAQNRDWIGGWHLGAGDRHVVGDFNGDGIDDVFIRSDQWAAILLSDGRSLRMEWISGDPANGWNWIGAWQLQAGDREIAGKLHYDPKEDVFTHRPDATGTFLTVFDGQANQFQPRCGWVSNDKLAPRTAGPGVDRFYLGNFVGDGRTDVLVFNGERLALYRNDSGSLARIWQSGEWIGGWRLGPFDRLYVGDFTGDGRDDIFIRSPLWAGLLRSTGSGFENVWMTGDPAQNRNWIGGWRLGPKDQHYVGRFTGDNRADIFIRSARWAGLLRSTGSGFENVWMTGDPAQNRDWIGGWHLGPQDRHYVGEFNVNGSHDI